MRPVFVRAMPGDPAAFLAALQRGLDVATGKPGECRGKVFRNGAILRLCDAECRVWSPALHLAVEDSPDGVPANGWQLRATFSPSSPVWTATQYASRRRSPRPSGTWTRCPGPTRSARASGTR